MSLPKFAAITSDLLARKGEARPWTEPELPPKQPLAWRPFEAPAPPPLVAAASPMSPMPVAPMPLTPLPAPPLPSPLHDASPQVEPLRADWKKYVLRISQRDYERLGILAVKQGKTRQRLLQETVDCLFTGMTAAYGKNCPCLGDERRA